MLFKRTYSNITDNNEFVIVGKNLDNHKELIDYIKAKDHWCNQRPNCIFIRETPIELNKDQSIIYQVLEKYKHKIKYYYEARVDDYGNPDRGSYQDLFYFIGIFSETRPYDTKYHTYLIHISTLSLEDYTTFDKVDLKDSSCMLFSEGDGIYFDSYGFIEKISGKVIRDIFQDNEEMKELKTRYTFSYEIDTDGDFHLFNRTPDEFEQYKASFTFKSFAEAKNCAISTLNLMIETHKGRCLENIKEALEIIKNDKNYYSSGNQTFDIKITKSMV